MEQIFNFLTGGVFTSLKDLFTDIINYLIRLVVNGVSTFLNPICDWLMQNVPSINFNYLDLTIFDTITHYMNYIFDASFIDKPVLFYALGSIIFRLTYKIVFYNFKLVIAWYRMLMP